MSISKYLSVHLMNEKEASEAIKTSEFEKPVNLWEKKVSTTVKKISGLLENISNGCEHTLSDEEISTLMGLRDAIGIWDFQGANPIQNIGILASKRFPRRYGSGVGSVVFSSSEEGDFLSLIKEESDNTVGKSRRNPFIRYEPPLNCAVFLLSVDGVSLCNALNKKIVVNNTAGPSV